MSFQSVCKRYCLFLTGVILCATGIAFITRAGLGTSPVSGLPFVLSLVTPVSMGFFTFLFNMIFLICEALLRKRFSVEQALQIPITFFFSFCIDKAMAIIPTVSAVPGVTLLSTWSSDVSSCPLASALRLLQM